MTLRQTQFAAQQKLTRLLTEAKFLQSEACFLAIKFGIVAHCGRLEPLEETLIFLLLLFHYFLRCFLFNLLFRVLNVFEIAIGLSKYFCLIHISNIVGMIGDFSD